MKKFICLMLTFLFLITITACKSNSEKTESKTTTTVLQEDVVVTAEKNNYSLNTKEIIGVWQNNSDKEIGLGNEFELEKEINNKFETVNPERKVLFDLPLIKLPKNEKKEIKYSIDNYKLESGKYRIKTEYIDDVNQKQKKYVSIYFEFTIK